MKPKILLIGDEIIDEYIIGTCNRVSPEAPVVIVNIMKRIYRPGGAANVRDNLVALGASVECYFGDKNPSIKTRIVADNKQITRVDNDNLQQVLPPKDLENKVKKCDIIMVSDYDKGVVNIPLMSKLLELKKKYKKRILVDPYKNRSKYGAVDLLKPNRKELESVVGFDTKDRQSLYTAGREYLEKSEAENLVVTLGGEGIALWDRKTYWDKPIVCKSEFKKEVIDLTGAGDTVFAVLGFIWSFKNFSKSTSLRYANKAASISVSQFGCGVVTAKEVFDEEKNNSFY